MKNLEKEQSSYSDTRYPKWTTTRFLLISGIVLGGASSCIRITHHGDEEDIQGLSQESEMYGEQGDETIFDGEEGDPFYGTEFVLPEYGSDSKSEGLLGEASLFSKRARGMHIPDVFEDYSYEESLEVVDEEGASERSGLKVLSDEEALELANNEIFFGDRERPVVIMSYNDGGRPEDIRHLMDVYEKYNLRTTFFVQGQWISRNRELTKEMIERGFEIGSSGWNNAEMTSLDEDEIRKQIEDFILLMGEIDEAYNLKFIRFPYGSRNDKLRLIAAQYGLQSVMWSHGSGGVDESTYDNIMRHLQWGSVVLSHSTRYYDVYQAEKIILSLLEQGYDIATVSEGIAKRESLEDFFSEATKEILSLSPNLEFDQQGNLYFENGDGEMTPVLTFETERHLTYPYKPVNEVKFFIIHYDAGPLTLSSGAYRTVFNTLNGLNRAAKPSVQFCVDPYPVSDEVVGNEGLGVILSQRPNTVPYKGAHVHVGINLETGAEDQNRIKTARVYEELGVGSRFVDFVNSGNKDFDSYSLGVEQVGTRFATNFPDQFPPNQQIANLLALSEAVAARYDLSVWDIVGHHQVQEKSDPGDKFMLTLRYLLGLSYDANPGKFPDNFLEADNLHDYILTLREYAMLNLGEDRYEVWDEIYGMDKVLDYLESVEEFPSVVDYSHILMR